MKNVLLFISILFISIESFAQIPSRSGSIHTFGIQGIQRQFPCAGDLIFEENFSLEILPEEWTIFDLDNQVVSTKIDTIVSKGWQSIADFKDPSNRLLASPSWYESPSSSDDWLISPEITLTDNVCLSWYAYSVDRFFGERYEVRISTSGAVPDSFLNESPLLVVEEEDYFLNYRSVNLAAYAGQTVRIAFRHTSEDKFILALDDIRLSQVLINDLAMFPVEPPSGDAGSSKRIRGAIINQGSESFVFDSTLTISYNIDGGEVEGWIVPDSLVIEANDTLDFGHPVRWTPENDAVYRLCVWFNSIPDQNIENDTICYWVGIGTFTNSPNSIDPTSINIYPNPVKDQLYLKIGTNFPTQLGKYYLSGIGGKVISSGQFNKNSNEAYRIPMAILPKGMYFLIVEDEEGSLFVKKIQK